MIRDVIEQDIELINSIGSQIKEDFVNKFDVINIKNRSYEHLYVYEDDVIKGFIHIEDHEDFIDLVNIAVDPQYKRQGIALKLINFIVEKYPDIKILLEVRESNDSAIGLYTKCGFKEIHRRKKYYGNEDAIIMERSI